MTDNKQDVFENYAVPKAIASLALPTIIGMIVMAFYNIVDTYFIGQTNDPVQVAAVSLSMPIFMLLMAFGNLFGIGASSNISRNLGAKNYNIIKNIGSTAFYGAILTGIVVCVIAMLGMRTLTHWLGADEFSSPYVSGYLNLILLGAPFIISSSALSHMIRSEGHAKIAMLGMLLSTVVNISLDPILIFVCDFGVIGAAGATVVANIVSFVFYIFMICKSKNSYVSLHLKYVTVKDGILKNILLIGTPASVTSIFTSVSTILYNLCLVPYGNEAVAAMGIVMKVTLLYTMIFMGISTGIQPLLGYCYGAKKYDRLKESVSFALKISVAIGTVFLIVIYTLSGGIVSVFIDDMQIIGFGTQMLRVQILTAPILGVLYISMSTMQAVGKSLVAMILSLSRQGIAFIPTIFILDRLLGFEGLIWAQVIADLITLVIAVVVFSAFYQSLDREFFVENAQ